MYEFVLFDEEIHSFNEEEARFAACNYGTVKFYDKDGWPFSVDIETGYDMPYSVDDPPWE